MAVPAAAKPSLSELWSRLEALGPLEKGEIIDGELHVQPRPRFMHGRTNTFLGRHLGGSFDFDDGGPGGWWIVVEPGIELPSSPEISPDLAGWRRERVPNLPDEAPIRSVPDWVCEVLSPSNARYDHLIKFPYYAKVGVEWLWVVDPAEQLLEVRHLHLGQWLIMQSFGPEDAARAQPFEAIELPLPNLWRTQGPR